jgi:hypothetical protein
MDTGTYFIRQRASSAEKYTPSEKVLIFYPQDLQTLNGEKKPRHFESATSSSLWLVRKSSRMGTGEPLAWKAGGSKLFAPFQNISEQ